MLSTKKKFSGHCDKNREQFILLDDEIKISGFGFFSCHPPAWVVLYSEAPHEVQTLSLLNGVKQKLETRPCSQATVI